MGEIDQIRQSQWADMLGWLADNRNGFMPWKIHEWIREEDQLVIEINYAFCEGRVRIYRRVGHYDGPDLYTYRFGRTRDDNPLGWLIRTAETELLEWRLRQNGASEENARIGPADDWMEGTAT